jgi:hypothetical protein
MRTYPFFLLLIFFLIPAALIKGQEITEDEGFVVNDTINDDFGLFTNDEVLDLTLRFDMTSYRRKKQKDEYLDALLIYHINETDSVVRQVRLKSRGEFRNEYCDFPPIRLNFKNAGFQMNDLKDIGKMKVVTHCMYGEETYLLKEYLAYKLYNALTDYSFRVRLVRMNYVNTAKKGKTISSFAFFIEPLDILAHRTGTTPVDITPLSMKNIAPEHMDRVAIFNYMIGNTDWAVFNQHNCKILSVPYTILGVVVPYDFDYSGLVDANYAIPHESLSIKSVRERLFFGLCRNDDEYSRDLELFIAKKEELYNIIKNFKYLDERDKKQMIGFLDGFYELIDRNNTIIRIFKDECKE